MSTDAASPARRSVHRSGVPGRLASGTVLLALLVGAALAGVAALASPQPASGDAPPAAPAGEAPWWEELNPWVEPSQAGIFHVGHRAAGHEAPENTIAAIDHALQLPVDMFEVDVQLTADGEPVVFHDTTLERTTDADEVFPDREPWRVGDFTAAEIAELDAGSWYDAAYAGEPVPMLDDVLERVSGQVMLMLDLKPAGDDDGALAERVVDELQAWADRGAAEADWVERGVVIFAFDQATLVRVDELMPELHQVVLAITPSGLPEQLPDHASFVGLPFAHFVDDGEPDGQEHVERIEQAGVRVVAAYMDEMFADPSEQHGAIEATLDPVLDAGVVGVMTDHPSLVAAMLADREARAIPGCPWPGEVDDAPGDVDGEHRDAVACAVAGGLAHGTGDDVFDPHADALRGQTASMLDRLLVDHHDLADPAEPATFPDVDPDDVHAAALGRLGGHAVVVGLDDGRAAPWQPLGRGQAASMVLRGVEAVGAELPDDEEVELVDLDGGTHDAALERLAAAGVVVGDAEGRARAYEPVTRAQLASMLVRLADRI